MQLREGSELQNGKYRILRVLGQGGFGITYLAEHTMLDKMVAIKEFFPRDFCGRNNTSHLTLGSQNNAETMEKLKVRFLKEAKNIAKLDHPGIVKIYDIFEENNTAYYVMDYIEGENLSEMVKRQGPLSEAKAVEYIKKVGGALEYIHSRNMTHFDVKPANIVIRKKDDSPVLIDFGLSKQYDMHGDATSTLMQGVSHGYSPIELYNSSSVTSFSPQTDVYSLGATFYFLLTGTVPPAASEVLEKGVPDSYNISKVNLVAIKNAMSVDRTSRLTGVNDFCNQLKESENHDGLNTIIQRDIKNKFIIGTVIFIIITSTLIVILTFRHVTDQYNKSVDKELSEGTKKDYVEKNLNEFDEYVDLGLPSGTKWSSHNFNAEDSYSIGEYLCIPSSKSIEQDVARLIGLSNSYECEYSGNWTMKELNRQFDACNGRLPTRREVQELINICRWFWVEKNGQRGYEVHGVNGNVIFLPAGGFGQLLFNNGNLVNKYDNRFIEYKNSNGSYWIGNALEYRLCFSENGITIDKNSGDAMQVRLVLSNEIGPEKKMNADYPLKDHPLKRYPEEPLLENLDLSE